MDSPDKYKSTIAFTDLLFNILVGFVFLFLIAFLLINPIARKGDVIVPAEFLITLTWPDDSLDDVDLWVRGPDNTTIGFMKKDGGLMHLDRDDRGVIDDTITIDGKESVVKLNREVISIRGKTDGEYRISVHWYHRPNFLSKDNGLKAYDQIPITVEVQKINPYSIIYKQTKYLKDQGEVQNFYKFYVDKNGNVTNIIETDESIVPVITKASNNIPYAMPEYSMPLQ